MKFRNRNETTPFAKLDLSPQNILLILNNKAGCSALLYVANQFWKKGKLSLRSFLNVRFARKMLTGVKSGDKSYTWPILKMDD